MNSFKDTTKNTAVQVTDKKDTKTLRPYITTGQEQELYTITEKARLIVKATYMLAGILEDTDHMKQRLMNTATDVLSAYYDINQKTATSCLHELIKLNGLIDLLLSLGNITKMNADILMTEISRLYDLTMSFVQPKNTHRSMAKEKVLLTSDMFDVDMVLDDVSAKQTASIGKQVDVSQKRSMGLNTVDSDSLLLVKKDLVKKSPITAPKKTASPVATTTKKVSIKDKRHENILLILAQKKDASINDICALFKECSSKTIQRDLNELIDSGQVLKKGDRRWSTYNLIK